MSPALYTRASFARAAHGDAAAYTEPRWGCGGMDAPLALLAALGRPVRIGTDSEVSLS